MTGFTLRITDDEARLRAAVMSVALENEQWAVVGGTDLYGVSDAGRVFGVRTRTMLKPGRTRDGHLFVSIAIAGQYRSPLVHRLVAAAFVPNPDQLPLVRHLDDVKTHNTPENLVWGTDDDNYSDMVRNDWLRKIAKVQRFGAHPRPGHPRYLQPWERLRAITLPAEGYRPSLTSSICWYRPPPATESPRVSTRGSAAGDRVESGNRFDPRLT